MTRQQVAEARSRGWWSGFNFGWMTGIVIGIVIAVVAF